MPYALANALLDETVDNMQGQGLPCPQAWHIGQGKPCPYKGLVHQHFSLTEPWQIVMLISTLTLYIFADIISRVIFELGFVWCKLRIAPGGGDLLETAIFCKKLSKTFH